MTTCALLAGPDDPHGAEHAETIADTADGIWKVDAGGETYIVDLCRRLLIRFTIEHPGRWTVTSDGHMSFRIWTQTGQTSRLLELRTCSLGQTLQACLARKDSVAWIASAHPVDSIARIDEVAHS